MLIQDMTRQMSLEVLGANHLGRIACARGAQPYVTPFSYTYHESFIYSFATVGRKIEWMRSNPLVCVEIEKIVNRREWQTVVILGRFEELSATWELSNIRQLAHDVLAKTVNWWEPGYVKTLHHAEERKLEAVYFRISIDEISGHQAFAHEQVGEDGVPAIAPGRTPR